MISLLLWPKFAQSQSDHFIILSDSNQSPYSEAVEGALSELKAHRVGVYYLDHDPDKNQFMMAKIALTYPKAIIGIGGKAVVAIKENPIPGTNKVFCLTTHTSEALEIPGSAVIPIYPDLGEFDAHFKQVLPGQRIALPFDPNRSKKTMAHLMAYFRQTSTEIVPIEIDSPSQINRVLEQNQSRYDALWLLPDSSFIDSLSLKYILDYTRKKRLPVIGFSTSMTKEGAIFSLSGTYKQMGAEAAKIAKQQSSGKHIDGVHYVKSVDQSINIRVAKILDLQISSELQALAFMVYPTNPKLQVP